MRLPPLGDCKPSVMLPEMLEFCLAAELASTVITFLYLQRLPQEISVLLSEDDPGEMRPIAKKADRLIAMHVPQSHNACAAVAAKVPSEELDMVAALQEARARKGKGPKQPQQKALGRRINLAKRSTEQGHSLCTSMCYHAKFSEQAKYCEEGLLLAGKLGCQGVVAAVCPGHLFFVTDSLSHHHFFVDTGSAFSIMPWQLAATPTGPRLSGRWPPHPLLG